MGGEPEIAAVIPAGARTGSREGRADISRDAFPPAGPETGAARTALVSGIVWTAEPTRGPRETGVASIAGRHAL